MLQDGCEYTSDSNGYWIYRSWDAILQEGHDRIQVLTHPEWWHAKDSEPGEKICAVLDRRSIACWRDYQALLRRGNRVNRTGLAVDNVEEALAKIGSARLPALWLSGERELAAAGLLRALQSNGAKLDTTDITTLKALDMSSAAAKDAFERGLRALISKVAG